jgi:hypothetical protein
MRVLFLFFLELLPLFSLLVLAVVVWRVSIVFAVLCAEFFSTSFCSMWALEGASLHIVVNFSDLINGIYRYFADREIVFEAVEGFPQVYTTRFLLFFSLTLYVSVRRISNLILFCVHGGLQHQEILKGKGTREGWNTLLEERGTWLQDSP